MITPRSYSAILSKSEKTVSDEVQAYLKEPSEENVHDLRTSIRKLLATAEILPKKIRRRKQSRKYLESCERLLKLNARVRDNDIVLSKMPNHGDDPAYSELAEQFRHSRESRLKLARQFASSLKNKHGITFHPEDISAPILQKHFGKTAKALAKKIKKRFQVVIEDPSNLSALHKLREDSRRLHFTLEMDRSSKSSKLLSVLESWQDLLGRIRDSDIFISRFEDKQDSSNIKEVLNQEKYARNENYQKFVGIAKENPVFR